MKLKNRKTLQLLFKISILIKFFLSFKILLFENYNLFLINYYIFFKLNFFYYDLLWDIEFDKTSNGLPILQNDIS